jgi:hypothetical protein
MNAKAAKKLRKYVADHMPVGSEGRIYGKDREGAQRVSPVCARGMYLKLKKALA